MWCNCRAARTEERKTQQKERSRTGLRRADDDDDDDEEEEEVAAVDWRRHPVEWPEGGCPPARSLGRIHTVQKKV